MASLTPDAFQLLLDQMVQTSLSLQNWEKSIPLFDYEQVKMIMQFFSINLTMRTKKLYIYLQKLVQFDEDEDRLTELLEALFESVSNQEQLPDWFSKISTDFLDWTTSDLLLENYFLFLGRYHQQHPLKYDSQFIQSIEHSSSSNAQFSLLSFISEQNLHVYENTTILQLFFDMPLDLKLQYIPIISDLKEEQRITVSKEILAKEPVTKDPFIVLSILFHMIQDLPGIFGTYKNFRAYIEKLGDDKTYELLYAEYVKPKALAQEWIQQLLLDKLSEGTNQALMILDASGEHIAEWPEEYRKEFLQVSMNGANKLQIAVAKMFSPLWYDEELIQKLLKNTNTKVKEALFESLVQLFQELSEPLQEKVEKLLREDSTTMKLYGLLQGYNFQVAAYYEQVTAAIENPTSKEKEELLAGMVLGLGIRWNDLDDKVRGIIKKNHTKMSKIVKEELLKGLDMIYVTLGVEDMNFVTELQSYDYQIAPDDIHLE